jgi:hypothetical protein
MLKGGRSYDAAPLISVELRYLDRVGRLEGDMPIILWLLGVPLVVVVLLMLTHVMEQNAVRPPIIFARPTRGFSRRGTTVSGNLPCFNVFRLAHR